ncbi:popeye domain-containing protein 3-like [Artemia franciscana]|uniref:POPDC1-3 domain-containing protein n=1 Tax=Artemia franciscana TaxID=6661 RepID=A0AA88L143_ARTSF|nr:hypothetical protein QYM36_009860 [Artemia franciscana]
MEYALNTTWANFLLPCPYWRESQHILFQLANGCFFFSSLAPNSKKGILFLHTFFIAGFFLYSTWSWNIICAPDVFSWTFGFMILNLAQVIHGVYILRPVKLDAELEPIYKNLFEPLGVERKSFKKFVCSEYAQVSALNLGDPYALQNLTRSDRLGLLLSGKANVFSDRTLLHSVEPFQFLDSPEFQSCQPLLDDKFKVSIVATMPSRYIWWSRSSMEYILVKEPQVAIALSLLVARDVTSKLAAMNDKISYEKGYRVDMRLHCISFSPVPKSIGKMGSYYSDTFSSPKKLAFKVSSTYSFMQNGNIMLDESSI